MLTQRSRYALRALMVMAKAGDSAPVSMNFIAAEANVPRKFLELILTDLRQAGLVVSFRGKMGGFRLARPPHLISFGDIIRTIEGPLALVPCVSRTAYRPCNDCEDEATCAIRRAMMVVRDDTARILDGTSLADAMAEDREAA
ncbi:transcriptional regulator [Tardibacter chloracetimidivorans]|uniref:Transcriptional regulator n=1 Tax=Tardibacter chloracetimidivorans TaxID=1921510 RepID=A0A1L3ZWL4_9SPHN|nr:Rrf2 family transcriptional regulator [Tardibacter chloracetimidivorans]API60017.1 transcriptional regulator [Tardibacter chloracetimidivorans]